MRLVRAAAPLAIWLAACGGGGGGGGGGGDHDGGDDADDGSDNPVVELTIEPSDLTLTIEDGVAATADFTATGRFQDGSTGDVTDQVSFDLDDSRLGSFDGASLTTGTDVAGRTQVVARVDGETATATLTVKMVRRYSDPAAGDLPPDPGGLFGGDDAPELAPQLVYPSDGVLIPPNLRQLEIHFVPAAGTEVFALSFSTDLIDVVVYTTCTTPLAGGCIYQPDADVWRWVAESSRGLGPVAVGAAGTDLAGSGVGHGAPIEIAFSQDDIKGGIYYWTTSQVAGSETAIMRFDFASPDQVAAERVVGPEMTGGHCVGCHALSRDGVRLLTSSEGSYDAMILLLDLSTGAPVVPWNTPPPSAFSSWNPDGTQYVGVFADETQAGWQSYDLNIFDGATGQFVESVPVGGTETQPANHPDWSPDGDRIVYTQVGQAANAAQGTLAFAQQCSLRMVTRPGAGEAFGAPVELTASVPGQSTYYPTFSPEGDLIAFNRSTCAGGQNGDECDAYDDPTATLFVIEPEAGAAPTELARANAPGPTDVRAAVENSFPKWAPFTFAREAGGGGRLHWMTFSSDRNYGLRTPQPGTTLIWMAAVDPDRAPDGDDASYPALALPFQDLATDNHTAQWAEAVVDVD
ncbi:MAG TPA: hypothetical protein VKB80_01170 [Kofleriaceae bacterium]|nr:hypothetical protein [Kofleriaceae bacterium]